MKVLFFYVGPPTPILETDLELIRKHERQGDSVRVLQCTGKLANCHWNKQHDNLQCAACRSRFRRGWEVLQPGPQVVLREFPARRLEPGVLPDGFDSVEDLKHFRHDGESLGYGAASGLISFFRDHRFDTRRHHDAVMRELTTSVQVYESLKQEFLQDRPDRVYIFNGRIASHLPAYLLCRRMGIEFCAYEVANRANCYRILSNRRVHEPLTQQDIAQLRAGWTREHEEAGEALVRQKRLGRHLAKVEVFTAAQVRGLLPPDFDTARRNIAVFNGTLDEYAGVQGWESDFYQPDETACLRRVLQAFETDDRFVFYLRVHPHLKEVAADTSQLRDIAELAARFRNLRVIARDDDIDTYALMDACEKTLTFGSTMGIEATYWGKPSILAGRAIYENLDCVYRPRNYEELADLLRADLQPMPDLGAKMYFYWEVSEGIPYSFFQETGLRNGLATGLFDGVEIRPDRLPRMAHEVVRFVRGAAAAARHPSTALVRLKQYAKTLR